MLNLFLERLVVVLMVAWGTSHGLAFAQEPLSPITVSGKNTEFVIETTFFKFPANSGDSSSDGIQELVRQLDPSQVRILGGESIASATYSVAAFDVQPEEGSKLPRTETSSKGDWSNAGHGPLDDPVSKTSDPSLLIYLTEADAEKLIQKCKQDIRYSMTQAPTATAPADRDAMVFDGQMRPFVVGISRIVGETEDQTAWDPTVRVYPEGTRISMKVETAENNCFRLEAHLELSQITSVRNYSFDLPRRPNQSADTSPLQIQHPIIEKDCVSFSANLEEGVKFLAVFPNAKVHRSRAEKGVPVNGLKKVFKRTEITETPCWEAAMITVTPIKREDDSKNWIDDNRTAREYR